jgi:hypothetical protein
VTSSTGRDSNVCGDYLLIGTAQELRLFLRLAVSLCGFEVDRI